MQIGAACQLDLFSPNVPMWEHDFSSFFIVFLGENYII